MSVKLLDYLGRGVTLLAIAVLVAYPVRAFLLAPNVPPPLKAAFLVLLGIGLLRPVLGAATMLALVPLVPLTPYVFPGVPHGIVHVIVLAQALPLLWRSASSRAPGWPDAVQWMLALFVAVGAASVASFYATYSLTFPSVSAFASELHSHLLGYIFERPGPGVENAVVALSTLVDGMLAYLVVRALTPPAVAWRFLTVLAGAAVLVAVMGLLQMLTGLGLRPMWQIYDPGIVRINATYTDPNALATFLAVMIPIGLALAGAAESVRSRLMWLGSTLLLAVALVATAGRMAYLAAIIGTGVLAFGAIRLGLDARDAWPLVRRGLRPVALIVSVLLVGGVSALTVTGTLLDVRHSDQHSYLHTVLYTLNLRQPLDEKLKGRVTVWRTAGMMVQDAPAFGIGLGTMYRQFPSYNQEIGGFEPEIRLSAHNTFLNIAAELGLVGLTAWLMLLAGVYASAMSAAGPNERDRTITWLRLGLCAGLVVFGVTMLTGDRTILREDMVLFGAVAALAVSLGRPPASGLRWLGRTAAWGILLIALLWPVRVQAERRDTELARIEWGFHGSEADPGGEWFRWTTGRAAFHIPREAQALTLPVRSLAPFPQRIRVLLDGVPADELLLQDHSWHTLRYVLPQQRDLPRYRRIELRIEPTWEPEGDGRVLGVMVGAHRLSSLPDGAETSTFPGLSH